jgi:Ca-activated chloride channel family protein
MRRRWFTGLAALPLFSLSLIAAPAAGQGWIEPLNGRPDPGVVKVRTNVMVRVTDRVALVEVEEWFRNNGVRGLGEGDYIYPLPGEAVFSNFSLFQGDQELRGETMDANRARSIYEEIVRRKKDPALIELVGHGMVRARVFPINPGETRRITMRYTQVLKRAGDALQFRYAAAGRFAGILPAGTERGQGAQRVREDAPLTFSLTAENGELFGEPFSPTHEVRIARERGRLTVRPQGSLSGDFVLFLPLGDDAVGLTLATHRPSGEDGYFMLTLSPSEVRVNTRVQRDITAVVDVSGSMSGEKIEQARAALRQLLQSLDRGDRFRLIRFSSGVSSYDPDWTPATPEQIRNALEWVDELRAEGGTNISGALAEAFRATSPGTRLPVVVFMTDGLPSAGETNPERIAQIAERAGGRTRVFAFGVGYDVNTYLLDRLGAAGRGNAQYVQPGEDVEQALGTLATRIRHPVLADLEIAGSPVRFDDVYPRELPDLFAGDELVIFGRYQPVRGNRRDASGDLVIRGQRNGGAEQYALRATFPAHENDNDFIPRLWASRKIGALQQEVKLNGANPELVEEIRQTALRYGLLSEYTSYLVQEPELLMSGAGADRALMGNGVMPTAAPASARRQDSLSSGRQAVLAAEASRRSREARTLADVMQAQSAAMERAEEVDGRIGNESGTRTVAGRHFTMKNGEWVDVAWREGVRTITVEPFSEAYFAVLRALPELGAYWKAFDRVTVMGRAVAIQLEAGGTAMLNAADVAGVVQQFRAK